MKNKTSLQNYLHERALLLEYLTIGWNALEGVVSVTLGLLTGSVSLLAFGLESSIEVFSSSVTVWELKGTGKGRERKALKMIGFAYLLVSAYIFFDASRSLFQGLHSEPSVAGIIFMTLTFAVMLALGILKKDVGIKMNNRVVCADAKFTIVDAALSFSVLIGLVANFLFGWWWIDQALALFIAGAAFREGIKEIS